MKITANQQVIDKSIKVVESYASKEGSGGSINLTAILIEADKDTNTVTLTAENEISATQYILSEGVEVKVSGKILVPAGRLKIAVSNIPAGEDVELESDDL